MQDEIKDLEQLLRKEELMAQIKEVKLKNMDLDKQCETKKREVQEFFDFDISM